MARPKMKFTPDEAVSLIQHFATNLKDYEFCKANLVRESTASRYVTSSDEPKKTLEPLIAMADAARTGSTNPVPFPEEGCAQLKDWITTWVTSESWTRLLAARRQRESKRKKRSAVSAGESAVDMPGMAAHYLSQMAERVGMDRKTFIGKLADYLELDGEGQKARLRLETALRDQQRKETRALLLTAFACTPGHLDYVLEQLPGDFNAKHDQAYEAAHKLGKVKLSRLAAWAKRVDAEDPLRVALFPHANTVGVSPLAALSCGVPLPSLKKTPKQDTPVQQ